MRVNVYHEELTRQSEIVWTEPRPGVRYCGLRIFQRSSPSLHANGTDDDPLWCASGNDKAPNERIVTGQDTQPGRDVEQAC